MAKLDELKALMARHQENPDLNTPRYVFKNALYDNASALIAAVEAAKAVADDVERSLYGYETEDPACCDPYLVGRQKMKALRAKLAPFIEENDDEQD